MKEAFNPMNDTRQRPGDIYMSEFDIYGEAFFDISVISICAPSHAIRASKGQLEGSKIRYEQKMAKYPELGARFKPMVIKSTEGWNAYSFNNLKLIANHIAARTNKAAQDCLNDLLMGSSFCLQRVQGDASSTLSRAAYELGPLILIGVIFISFGQIAGNF